MSEKETQDIEPEEAPATESAEAQADAPKRGWRALSRNAKIGMGAGCAVVVAVVVGIGAYALAHQGSALPADEPAEGAQLAEPAEEGEPQRATLGYKGYEPEEGDTPVIVHVTGTTDGNRSVDFYHLVSAASGDVELSPGMYTAETLPVLLADGSMVAPEGGQASFSVDDAAVEASQAAATKAADDVTEADLAALLGKIAEATAKGDSTLKGDAGKDAASKVAEAVKATGKVNAEQVEQAAQKAEEGSKGQPQATAYGASSEALAASQEGASSSPAPAASASQPAHEHSWQAVTEQRWAPNNVWVEDSAAWDEPVYESQEREICTGCGADITGNPYAHIAQSRTSPCQGFKTIAKSVLVDTVHHDATGHYEDQGHYETVTTGYRCSTCGATK